MQGQRLPLAAGSFHRFPLVLMADAGQRAETAGFIVTRLYSTRDHMFVPFSLIVRPYVYTLLTENEAQHLFELRTFFLRRDDKHDKLANEPSKTGCLRHKIL
ncbi:hypothetical protein OUZ56_025244 [Daphnia magna]|uniref:Uncharacterized protein n=1 Tax=Daphnia magna TaxID=35525 RepID=A0ABQ9ZJW5_9CRUS|nr:hypothetical protein OUZ56_025244 [Daphnia magna]